MITDDIKKTFRYSQTSNDIQVSVIPFYLENESIPQEYKFIWAYQVRIENKSDRTVKLYKRTWIITDENGGIEVVKGEGVVGEQPIFTPGSGYEYTSFVALTTPSGLMHGSYEMVDQDLKHTIDVAIPTFSLDMPNHKPLIQ